MERSELAHVFWEEIPGPRRILGEITGALREGHPVLLDTTEAPWLKDLRYMVCAELQKEGVYAEEIDARESGANHPGNYLLDRFGKKEEINGYREGIDPPLPDYLRSRGTLEGKLLCVWGVQPNRFKAWSDFVTRYKSGGVKGGVFLLESAGGGLNLAASARKLAAIDARQRISVYDVLSFAMLLASPLALPEIWKHYLAWYASTVFERDIETLAAFLTEAAASGGAPGDLVRALEARAGDPRLLARSAWRAQLQIIFPVIENLRVEIITRYRDRIQTALDRTEVLYCGKKIKNPYEAELGYLVYLANQGNLLSFPHDDYSDIAFLHECRNSIAHMDPCDMDRLMRIIALAGPIG